MLSRILIQNKKGDYVDFRPSPPENEEINADELIRPLPKKKGSGHFSSISLCGGLSMGSCQCRFDEEYMGRFISKKPLFSLAFCLKGQSLTRDSLHPDPVTMVSGRAYTLYYDDPVIERIIRGQQEVLSLAIHVSPEFLIQLLAPAQHQGGAYQDTLDNILKNHRFYAEDRMTNQMKTTIFQILHNPHKGRISNIYLESKALELIALRLEQVSYQECSTKRIGPIRPQERERIYRARDLLVRKLHSPPSLRDLARQAGMSHSRLTNGFKMVFGRTVFEYLRKERLAYARMLIEEKPVDLTSVAFEAGFCSSSHFAAAFLKEYGIRPSEYRKQVQLCVPADIREIAGSGR